MELEGHMCSSPECEATGVSSEQEQTRWFKRQRRSRIQRIAVRIGIVGGEAGVRLAGYRGNDGDKHRQSGLGETHADQSFSSGPDIG